MAFGQKFENSAVNYMVALPLGLGEVEEFRKRIKPATQRGSLLKGDKRVVERAVAKK